MSSNKPLLTVFTVFLLSTGMVYFVSFFIESTHRYVLNQGENTYDNWIFRLTLNLFGYSTIFVPGLILYYYVYKNQLLDRSDRGWLNYLVKQLYFDVDTRGYTNVDNGNDQHKQRSLFKASAQLIFCSFGLLISYLTWGLMQEKMMTKKYVNLKGETGMFQNSQFLVFANRVLAFILSGAYVILVHQPKHTVPLYKYAYCSFSNIMSSWCQYEALKFISFPAQVLAKACKLIPVMIMGAIISRNKYDYYEYIVAVLISTGVGLFLLGSSDVTKNDQTVTTLSGIMLITGYMAFDSFTSNWQGALFTKYNATSVQMMCGVNFFSCLLTSVSLMQQHSFKESSYFMLQFPDFAIDCILLSICSAFGQLFIFYTISSFGPVVFVIIMTVRQALAVMLSCIIYHHEVRIIGIIGISIVFLGIFLRIYWSQRLKVLRKKKSQKQLAI